MTFIARLNSSGQFKTMTDVNYFGKHISNVLELERKTVAYLIPYISNSMRS